MSSVGLGGNFYISSTSQISSGVQASLGVPSTYTLKSTQTKTTDADTSFSFTSLDINTDGYYYVLYSLAKLEAGATDVKVEVNADTTVTNYYLQLQRMSDAVVTTGRYNVNNAIRFSGSDPATGIMWFYRDPLGYPHAFNTGDQNVPASVFSQLSAIVGKNTVANITQLDFSLSAGHYKTGSTMSLYKVGK